MRLKIHLKLTLVLFNVVSIFNCLKSKPYAFAQIILLLSIIAPKLLINRSFSTIYNLNIFSEKIGTALKLLLHFLKYKLGFIENGFFRIVIFLKLLLAWKSLEDSITRPRNSKEVPNNNHLKPIQMLLEDVK